jgi:hypothetical protein
MKYPLYCVLLSLTILCCNKSESPTTPSGTTDFVPLPLKVGNTWIYSGGTESEELDTMRITGTTTINSRVVYVFNNRGLFDKEAFYYDSGVLYGMRVSLPDQKLEIVYPKNPAIGQAWHVDDIESTLRLEAVDETISVRAGAFSCSRIKLVADYPNVDSGFGWFSNGVGMVKVSTTSLSTELVSVALK